MTARRGTGACRGPEAGSPLGRPSALRSSGSVVLLTVHLVRRAHSGPAVFPVTEARTRFLTGRQQCWAEVTPGRRAGGGDVREESSPRPPEGGKGQSASPRRWPPA